MMKAQPTVKIGERILSDVETMILRATVGEMASAMGDSYFEKFKNDSVQLALRVTYKRHIETLNKLLNSTPLECSSDDRIMR